MAFAISHALRVHFRGLSGRASRPPEGWDTADYVLGRWNPEERESLDAAVSRAADAVEVLVNQGVEAAMNQFHVREQSKEASVVEAPKTQSVQAFAAYGV